MKQIKLTQGKFALVDDADYEWLSQWKWCASKDRNTFYATRGVVASGGKTKTIRMHRFILGTTSGQVDHENGNGLDNRRHNLRICNNSQNQYNQKPRTGSSKFKGVYWRKKNKKWHVRISKDGKRIDLGCFKHETEAAIIYDKKAKELFGEFARTNL